MEEIIKEFKKTKTLFEFLDYIRTNAYLELLTDNGWSWVEYKGKIIEGTEKERFTSSSDIDILLQMAGL